MLAQVVVAVRKLRTEQNLPPAQRVGISVLARSARTRGVIEANREAVLMLARGSALTFAADGGPTAAGLAEVMHAFGEPALVTIAAEVSPQDRQARAERVAKERDRLRADLERVRAKLANKEFTDRAPESVVAKVRAQEKELAERSDALAKQLAEMSRGEARD